MPIKSSSPSITTVKNSPCPIRSTSSSCPASPESSNPGTRNNTTAKERWNSPRKNIPKGGATYWSFIVLGMNDSSYGVLNPLIQTYYGISYLDVSLNFLSPVLGFIISTLTIHNLLRVVGMRGVVAIGGTCQIVAYVVACFHPPFYGLVLAYILVGLGAGTKNATWNSFISSLDNANELLGFLQGLYGLGATILPATASSLSAHYHWSWYMIYYILVAIAASDTLFSLAALKSHSAGRYVEAHEIEMQASQDQVRATVFAANPTEDSNRSITLQCLTNKVVILTSCYLLVYVGSEVALGGWLVTFMEKVRHGTAYNSGMVATGFWACISIGRIVLGFVTGRFFRTDEHAVVAYLLITMALELMLWLIPLFVASAVSSAFLGFFLGPLFPAAIICISKLTPKSIQITAIGMCAAVGASGASIVPFAVGAIAEAEGVTVLQPIIVACLALCLTVWTILPKLPGKKT